jgi:glucan endo-1,3-alpha-glucosidase
MQQDELIYYYRPNPKNAVCSDPVGKPDGFQFDDDLVFVTAMLTSPGTISITYASHLYFLTIHTDTTVHT